MKRRDLATVGIYALATLAVSMAVITSGSLVAGNENAAEKKIVVPTLTTSKTDMTLHFVDDKRVTVKDGTTTIQDGALPTMELVAVNRGDEDADIDYSIDAQRESIGSPSRRVPQASSVPMWSYSSTIKVPAGKTVRITLDPAEMADTPPAGQNIQITKVTPTAPIQSKQVARTILGGRGWVTLSVKGPASSANGTLVLNNNARTLSGITLSGVNNVVVTGQTGNSAVNTTTNLPVASTVTLGGTGAAGVNTINVTGNTAGKSNTLILNAANTYTGTTTITSGTLILMPENAIRAVSFTIAPPAAEKTAKVTEQEGRLAVMTQ